MQNIETSTNEVDEELRKSLCLYYTPGRLANFLIKTTLPKSSSKTLNVLEPSAGRGSFVKALRRNFKGAIIDCVELYHPNVLYLDNLLKQNKKFAPYILQPGDFLNFTPIVKYDYISGNPPFNLAEEFVKKSFKLLKNGGTLAFLLRLSMLESKSRIDFWKKYKPKTIKVLSERPSFFGGTTDMAAYAFYIWEKNWSGKTELEIVSWKK